MKHGDYQSLEQEAPTHKDEQPGGEYESRALACGIRVFCLILVASIAFISFYVMRTRGGTDLVHKQGAGLLFWHDDKVLLLLRTSINNNNTWGLPGGNLEAGDTDLLETAKREGTEELGPLPDFEALAEIKTKRGPQHEKHYSVFVCKLQEPFQPVLNYEHSAFQWFDITSVAALGNLHPVVKLVFSQPLIKQLAVATSSGLGGDGSGRKIEKLGAGLFFVCEGQALLLTRNSTHNNATLSVPGGNVDLGEKHPRETAEREAVEEMGACPEYEYKGEINTWRGKHKQKEFMIFLAAISPEVKASFEPRLDHESLGWGWYPLDELESHALHPVVKILVKDHMPEIKKAFGLD